MKDRLETREQLKDEVPQVTHPYRESLAFWSRLMLQTGVGVGVPAVIMTKYFFPTYFSQTFEPSPENILKVGTIVAVFAINTIAHIKWIDP